MTCLTCLTCLTCHVFKCQVIPSCNTAQRPSDSPWRQHIRTRHQNIHGMCLWILYASCYASLYASLCYNMLHMWQLMWHFPSNGSQRQKPLALSQYSEALCTATCNSSASRSSRNLPEFAGRQHWASQSHCDTLPSPHRYLSFGSQLKTLPSCRSVGRLLQKIRKHLVRDRKP